MRSPTVSAATVLVIAACIGLVRVAETRSGQPHQKVMAEVNSDLWAEHHHHKPFCKCLPSEDALLIQFWSVPREYRVNRNIDFSIMVIVSRH